MDRSEVRYRDLLQTLRQLSARPVIPHQYAIGRGEDLVGYVDLVSEEAHAYRRGQASDVIPVPADYLEREQTARREMLETLADFDDDLMALAARRPGATAGTNPERSAQDAGGRPGGAGVHGRGRAGHGGAPAARGPGARGAGARRPGRPAGPGRGRGARRAGAEELLLPACRQAVPRARLARHGQGRHDVGRDAGRRRLSAVWQPAAERGHGRGRRDRGAGPSRGRPHRRDA